MLGRINDLDIKDLRLLLRLAFVDARTGDQNIVYNGEDTFATCPGIITSLDPSIIEYGSLV